VWELGGLWTGQGHKEPLHLRRLNLGLQEPDEVLWLYEIEDIILMVEVRPASTDERSDTFGQVILKRLMNAETALARLHEAPSLVVKPH
jgi:hypothetical protein